MGNLTGMDDSNSMIWEPSQSAVSALQSLSSHSNGAQIYPSMGTEAEQMDMSERRKQDNLRTQMFGVHNLTNFAPSHNGNLQPSTQRNGAGYRPHTSLGSNFQGFSNLSIETDNRILRSDPLSAHRRVFSFGALQSTDRGSLQKQTGSHAGGLYPPLGGHDDDFTRRYGLQHQHNAGSNLTSRGDSHSSSSAGVMPRSEYSSQEATRSSSATASATYLPRLRDVLPEYMFDSSHFTSGSSSSSPTSNSPRAVVPPYGVNMDYHNVMNGEMKRDVRSVSEYGAPQQRSYSSGSLDEISEVAASALVSGLANKGQHNFPPHERSTQTGRTSAVGASKMSHYADGYKQNPNMSWYERKHHLSAPLKKNGQSQRCGNSKTGKISPARSLSPSAMVKSSRKGDPSLRNVRTSSYGSVSSNAMLIEMTRTGSHSPSATDMKDCNSDLVNAMDVIPSHSSNMHDARREPYHFGKAESVDSGLSPHSSKKKKSKEVKEGKTASATSVVGSQRRLSTKIGQSEEKASGSRRAKRSSSSSLSSSPSPRRSPLSPSFGTPAKEEKGSSRGRGKGKDKDGKKGARICSICKTESTPRYFQICYCIPRHQVFFILTNHGSQSH